MKTVVIVGSSLAGLRAAETLRLEKYEDRIVIVGAERHQPYDRPPLSKKVLLGEWEAERISLRKAEDLDKLNVEWKLGSPAQSLDTEKRVLTLSNGEEISYDGLIIATGSVVRRLTDEPDWKGIHVVRTLGRPGAQHVENKWELMDMITAGGTAIIGTPDDLVKAVRHLQEITGGFGVVLGFAHDWANRENTLRSWDLVARYVIPEINQTTLGQRASMKFLNDNQATLMAGAGAAVMQKILGDERASAELGVMMQQMQAQTDDRGATFRPGGGVREDQLPTEK